jgi:hypothetical protein
MRRLLVFIGVSLALLVAAAAFNWWVDPFAEVWKPGAVADARAGGCLVSQELIGIRYQSFKLDVFAQRPTRTFVVGSSRVLEIASHPGERSFSNLGYPGTAPETILKLFRALPAKPVQTVYVGVEAFWLNKRYAVPDTDPSAYHLAEYLLSRSAFTTGFKLVRQAHYILEDRWRKTEVGGRCVIGRIYPSINWRLDGSRVWSWELDPKRFPRFHPAPFTGNLETWRNGYFAGWRSLDERRVHLLEQALALARERGWQVVGFAPPEPPHMLHVLDTDPRIAPRWHEFLRLMPRLFARYGFAWAGLEDGLRVPCRASEFPDAFHTDRACSARVRRRLDEAARRLH